ncbi:hypothetical protein YPC_2748 [Yersinia pestis biovar Medievalis str. Harbin 35]|nr:hypothetical protein YPC_2748 [Yersinia pestis biovar Medievalis str. Harbin 35]EEO74997.1 hypothetical protein YP516_2881 [Yersinia pestis Nepal516]EEO81903.1 hypothetical protein YPF_1881 [Yersinia pestis biovar Orientalis str. India 195]EEO87803.1 hypothetical protein YPH_3773 [Yersinia pestis biovar Orientalis str. PEXU2]EEO88822.1 hypothetical protein YPS_3672 [Yersinia pestis Pestoides A]
MLITLTGYSTTELVLANRLSLIAQEITCIIHLSEKHYFSLIQNVPMN